MKIFEESETHDAQGFVIFRDREQAGEALNCNGDVCMGRKIFFRYPWSSIDQFVKRTKHRYDDTTPTDISQPVEFMIFERGKCKPNLISTELFVLLQRDLLIIFNSRFLISSAVNLSIIYFLINMY